MSEKIELKGVLNVLDDMEKQIVEMRSLAKEGKMPTPATIRVIMKSQVEQLEHWAEEIEKEND